MKIEPEVKNWQMRTKQLSTNLGDPFGGRSLTMSGGVPKLFFPLNPSLNFTLIQVDPCLKQRSMCFQRSFMKVRIYQYQIRHDKSIYQGEFV